MIVEKLNKVVITVHDDYTTATAYAEIVRTASDSDTTHSPYINIGFSKDNYTTIDMVVARILFNHLKDT